MSVSEQTQSRSPTSTTRRPLVTRVACRAWPADSAGRVLTLLIVLGVGLRVLACIGWWPTTILEDGYQSFANSNPFHDPQHPAGYALLLGAFGVLTHQLPVLIVIQHASGIASALLLCAATRRLTRSSWAGLFPAAVVLLDPDGIFLEHSVMSECWQVLATSLGLYAAVRVLDRPDAWRPWPLVAGVAMAIAATLRSAASLMIVVTVVALVLGQPPSGAIWRRPWRSPLAFVCAAAVVLVAYAAANAGSGRGFGLAPSPGWYLYGRVAQFADCHRFRPPAGTAALCERTPASARRSGYYYMFDSHAPAPRLFGGFGKDDSVIGSWARRAMFAQFGDFLATAWTYLRGYYVPGWRPARLKSSTELDPQLDFTNPGNAIYAAVAHEALEDFFAPFDMQRHPWAERALRRWQLIFRFGATALFISTVLVLIGLMIGTRRSRVGVLLFGGGGLSLLVAPVLTGTYSGRYTLPMAGPLIAAAAIAITQAWRSRRSPALDMRAGPSPGAAG